MEKIKNNYRRTVVGILVNEKDELLSVFSTRNNSVSGVQEDKNIWKLPQGGIDQNESVELAFLREMKEELSLNLENIAFTTYNWSRSFSYYFLNENNEPCFEIRLHPVLVRVRSNKVIKLNGDENSEFAWVKPCDFIKYNLGIRRQAYINILDLYGLL